MSNHSESRRPAYFSRLIDAYDAGLTGRHAHLGYWDEPEQVTQVSGEDFETAQNRMNLQLLGMISLSEADSILDVGCGFGGLLRQIDTLVQAVFLTGLNIDRRQLEICQQINSVNGNVFRWCESDACRLPFSGPSFDVVFCVEAVFHFLSRRVFLQEAARVLKPGGRLLLTDFSLAPPAGTPHFLPEALLADGFGPWPDPFCREGTTHELLKSCNSWQDVDCRDLTLQTAPTWLHVLPHNCSEDNAPTDPGVRSALTLAWLQRCGGLRYECLVATRSSH